MGSFWYELLTHIPIWMRNEANMILPELDVLAKAMNHLKKDTFFEWAQELLRRPGHTVEFNILGRRIVMTDDQANIRTIFASNVGSLTKNSSQDTDYFK